jgi:cytoskeletal protein CcmA (bactofilin family)
MKLKHCLLALGLLNLVACASMYGGDNSSQTASNDQNNSNNKPLWYVGPATIGSGDQTLENSKYSALTVGGDLTATQITVINDLQIESDASLTQVTVRDDSNIKGNLNATKCTFKDLTTVGGNISSIDTYFGNGITFSGGSLMLSSRSKVIGNIISNSAKPATIIIDKSTVKGNIQFAAAGGKVILQNKGKLTGQVSNGQIINE